MVATGSGNSPFSVSRMTVSPRSPTSVPRCVLSAVDEQRGDDARALAGKSLVVVRPHQRPFEPGRLDFERVLAVSNASSASVDARRDAFARGQIDAASLSIEVTTKAVALPRLRGSCVTISTARRGRSCAIASISRSNATRNSVMTKYPFRTRKRGTCPRSYSNRPRLYGTENERRAASLVASAPRLVLNVLCEFLRAAGYVQLASAPVGAASGARIRRPYGPVDLAAPTALLPSFEVILPVDWLSQF